MKVTVWKPTGKSIGAFDISSIDELGSGFAKFAALNPVRPYDYLLVCNSVLHVDEWTILKDGDDLMLEPGRHYPPPGYYESAVDAAVASSSASQVTNRSAPDGIQIERRSGWAVGFIVIGSVVCALGCLAAAIIPIIIEANSKESDKDGAEIFLVLIILGITLVLSLNCIFIAFLVDVFTDIRWFLKQLVDKNSSGK